MRTRARLTQAPAEQERAGLRRRKEADCGGSSTGLDEEIVCRIRCLTVASCADIQTYTCTEGDGPLGPSLGACLEICDASTECANGDEIDSDWQCDGFPDCEDGSDEVDCAAFACADGSSVVGASMCNGAFECADHIVEDWRCNGDNDCANANDERNCPEEAQLLCAGVPVAP